MTSTDWKETESTEFYSMTPLEVATGWVPGYVSGDASRPDTPLTPRKTLEETILCALCRPPCVVSFSGGRDSSAVLAVAADVARREGLPPPVAATRIYPSAGETDEARWQEDVVRHVGVEEWIRLRFGTEHDLVGPVAAKVLRRHGVLWPLVAHVNLSVLSLAAGGSLLTGEGGDEIFGPLRASPIRYALASRSHPSRWFSKATVTALAPQRARRRILRPQIVRELTYPWLRSAARDAFVDAIVRDRAGEPLWWVDGALRLLDRRSWRVGKRTIDLMAGEFHVVCEHPLCEPAFVNSLSAVAGRWGFRGRGAAMAAIFGDLLPQPVLHRASKAVFNHVAFTDHSRAFVARWNGEDVDPDLVDPEALRREWASAQPHAGSYALIQTAWLANQTRHPSQSDPGKTASDR